MKLVFLVMCVLPLVAVPAAADTAEHSSEHPEASPQGALMTRTVLLPANTNPRGTAFGGWTLAQMDIAGGIIATQRAQGHIVTVGVDEMSFLKPIYVGDAVSFYAEIKNTGRTSITVFIEAWALRGRQGELEKVGEGAYTYVLVDQNGDPKPLP